MYRAAREPESVRVPWCLGSADLLDPFLCGRNQFGRRHNDIDQLHGLGAIDADLVALEQELQGLGRRQHPGDPLRAAAAGKQADLDLRQAKPRFRIVGRNTMMAGQRQFEAAAQSGAVDGRYPWLATGLDAATELGKPSALGEQASTRRFLALLLRRFGKHSAQRLENGQIGSGGKRVFAGGDDGAFDGFVAGKVLDDRRKFIHHRRVDDVHRAARNVPGYERNAVGAGLDPKIGKIHRYGSPFLCV